MDPSEVRGIKSTYSRVLEGKKIGLGVTGSVSAYKAVDLARALIRRGAEVYVIASTEALRYVGRDLLEWATGSPLISDFSGLHTHISYMEMLDIFIIAPATANTISKIAHGIADTSVTLLAQSFMGASKPVLIVPSMHASLLNSPSMARSMKILQEYENVFVLDPLVEEDKAKFPPVDIIAWKTEAVLRSGEDLRGAKILVTAGPTREYIDSVRFISNPSTGKMGIALAVEAALRGAEVTLVHGPLSSKPPYVLRKRISVTTTEEMRDAILEELRNNSYDAVIMAAAPIDYKPKAATKGKIDSHEVRDLRLELVSTPKILKDVREVFNGILVGFTAETPSSDEELVSLALAKLNKYKVDLMVANNVSRSDIGFASNYNEVYLLFKNGRRVKLEYSRKEYIARGILDYVVTMLKDGKSSR